MASDKSCDQAFIGTKEANEDKSVTPSSTSFTDSDILDEVTRAELRQRSQENPPVTPGGWADPDY